MLNPGVGELADRLTILQLKILHAPLDSDPSHFHEELAQVQMRLDNSVPTPAQAAVLAKVDELTRVNTRLWQLEDKMAEYARATGTLFTARVAMTIAELGITIWRANQLRNVTIGEINELARTVRGPEKL